MYRVSFFVFLFHGNPGTQSMRIVLSRKSNNNQIGVIGRSNNNPAAATVRLGCQMLTLLSSNERVQLSIIIGVGWCVWYACVRVHARVCVHVRYCLYSVCRVIDKNLSNEITAMFDIFRHAGLIFIALRAYVVTLWPWRGVRWRMAWLPSFSSGTSLPICL